MMSRLRSEEGAWVQRGSETIRMQGVELRNGENAWDQRGSEAIRMQGVEPAGGGHT